MLRTVWVVRTHFHKRRIDVHLEQTTIKTNEVYMYSGKIQHLIHAHERFL